jgi:hypothetical protein
MKRLVVNGVLAASVATGILAFGSGFPGASPDLAFARTFHPAQTGAGDPNPSPNANAVLHACEHAQENPQGDIVPPFC